MSDLRHLAPVDPLRPRPHRRRLRSLAILPTLFTLGNLWAGFAAIHFALHAMFDLGAGTPASEVQTFQSRRIEAILPTWLSIGAFMIIVGMVCDGLDGLAARLTRSTTGFGGQLDSLADVVTCGTAPALLTTAYMMRELSETTLVSPISNSLWGKFAWFCAASYVAFAAIRLARYNVEHDREDFDYRVFRGLPSPGAAAMMVACLLLHDQLDPSQRGWLVYAVPFLLFGTGILMVSRLPYRRVQGYFRGRKPFNHLILAVVLVSMILIFKRVALFLIVLTYVLSGPAGWFIRRTRMQHARTAADQMSRVG